MDRKSKYLIWAFVLLVIAAALWGYKAFIIDRNFVINTTTECDPSIESCFMWCEEGECEEDYYKKITKNASNTPVCNDAVEECEPLACGPDEADCEVIQCSVEELEEGEICTNPLDFQIEEPEKEATTTDTTESDL